MIEWANIPAEMTISRAAPPKRAAIRTSKRRHQGRDRSAGCCASSPPGEPEVAGNEAAEAEKSEPDTAGVAGRAGVGAAG